MDPPADFEPSDNDFARMADMPAWGYIGPLEPAIQWIRANHTDIRVYVDEDLHVIMSSSSRRHASTAADSEEEACRGHLGQALLGDDQPFPDDAGPGETIA